MSPFRLSLASLTASGLSRAALLCAGLGVLGCGKPATVKDCEKIIVKMTELELKANNVVDEKEVKAQVALTRETFSKRAMDECVGVHLSRSVMTCIDNAKSSEEILTECLN